MSSILFATWDGGGNVPPTLGIAAELRTRGHQVRVLGHPQQRDVCESAGLRFEPYQHARAWSPTRRSDALGWAYGYLRLCTDRGTGRDFTESVRREPIDVAVVDCMTLGALKAAHSMRVPRAVLVHTFYEYLTERFGRGPLNLAAKVKGMPPGPLWAAADRVIVATVPELETTSSLPANIRVTGPVQPPDSPAPVPHSGSEPRILVSLSSIHYVDQVRVIQSIMSALADLAVPVVLTTGRGVGPGEIRLPDNVDAHQYVPHAEILPRVSLVVGHGGHSTTMRALAHDLPLVMMPLSELADQSIVGAAVQRYGAGEMISKSATPDEIRAAIVRMLADGPHRAAAARLGAWIRANDGAATAADEIESLAGG